jgi:hypothetical protein
LQVFLFDRFGQLQADLLIFLNVFSGVCWKTESCGAVFFLQPVMASAVIVSSNAILTSLFVIIMASIMVQRVRSWWSSSINFGLNFTTIRLDPQPVTGC